MPAFLGNPLPTQPPQQGFKPPDGSVAAQMQRQQMDSLYQRHQVLSPMHAIGLPPGYASLYPLPAMAPAPMQPQLNLTSFIGLPIGVTSGSHRLRLISSAAYGAGVLDSGNGRTSAR